MRHRLLCLLYLLPVLGVGFIPTSTMASESGWQPSVITLPSLFPNHYSSKYFYFHSPIPAEKLAAYARFSDMFVDVVNRDFFKVTNRFPLTAFVLENKIAFQQFLNQKFHIQNPPEYGIYLGEFRIFVTYDGAGLGTFTHEISHPLVEESLKNRPNWAIEGIPAFFEKLYGHAQGGQLNLKWGYQNPWRIEQLGTNLKNIKLHHIIYSSESTSEKRLLSVFLYQRGKLKTYLGLVQMGNKKGYDTYEEAAFDKPLAELEKEWINYLQDIDRSRHQIYVLPNSRIFDTEAQYLQFINQNPL